jgi:hypothetical protein
MSQSHLAACPCCARHVRVSESACPFCRSALSDAFRATLARQAPRVRLTRAALFAFGTGVALTPALAACSSTSSEDAGVMPQPSYGIATNGYDATNGYEPDAAPESGFALDASAGDADAGATADAAPDAADAGAGDADMDAGETTVADAADGGSDT